MLLSPDSTLIPTLVSCCCDLVVVRELKEESGKEDNSTAENVEKLGDMAASRPGTLDINQHA